MPAFKDLFTYRLRLKRDQRGLRLVLQGTTRAAPASHAKAPSSEAPPDASRAMRSELSALLDRAAGSRRIVRHLAAIEHALSRKDPTGLFIFDMPIERLQTALREFDTLAGGNATPGLAALRNQLGAALTAHERRGRAAGLQQPTSSFLNEDKLRVNELRQSDFDKASEAWLAPPPGGKPAPKP